MMFVEPDTITKLENLAIDVLSTGKNPKTAFEDAAFEAYQYATGGTGEKGDPEFGAFRHAYISAKITQKYGEDTAIFMGDVNETFNPRNNNGQTGLDSQRVDDYNNDKGVEEGANSSLNNGLLGVDTDLANRIYQKAQDNELATKVSEVPESYQHEPSWIGQDTLQDLFQSSDELLDFLRDLADDYGWAFDNPGAILGGLFPDGVPGWLPSWLVPVGGVQGGAGLVGSFPGAPGCPLILDLDGDGVEATKLGWGAAGSHVYFDMDNDGFAERTAWATGGDGLLTLDRNATRRCAPYPFGWIDRRQESRV